MHAHDFLSIEACLGASWLPVPAVPDGLQVQREDEVLKLCSCHWRVQHGRQFRQCQLQNITHPTTVRQGGQEMCGIIRGESGRPVTLTAGQVTAAYQWADDFIRDHVRQAGVDGPDDLEDAEDQDPQPGDPERETEDLITIPEFDTAREFADDCDTCWWLLSVGPDSAEAELGEEVARAKLRQHIASGHVLTSEECM